MEVAKFKAPDTTDVMRAKDGVDNIIREAIGNQPFFYFPTRVGDSPGQLVQLLHTFDQQGVSNIYSGLKIYILVVHVQYHLGDINLFTLDINWIEACTKHVTSRAINIYLH